MINELRIGTIRLPRILVCDTQDEALFCREKGLPFILKPKGMSMDTLCKAVLYKYLKRTFPYIKWKSYDKQLEQLEVVKELPAEYREGDGYLAAEMDNDVMTATEEYRETGGGADPDAPIETREERYDVDEYIKANGGWHVDVEQLQDLKVLPVFMDDIATAIRKNMGNTMWMDGWNKKLEAPLGSFDTTSDAPNLIIIDTSGSVPSGISLTMHALMDTLRVQANADLILTSSRSVYIKAGDPLPDQDKLDYLIGGCNEARQFYKILNDHILGKHWGNVIVFGDNDAPCDRRFQSSQEGKPTDEMLGRTRIDRIMAFHTYNETVPGYGRWAVEASPDAEVVYNRDWCNYMKQRY